MEQRGRGRRVRGYERGKEVDVDLGGGYIDLKERGQIEGDVNLR